MKPTYCYSRTPQCTSPECDCQRDAQAGPCIICGLRDYPLSMGGPTICPACDCGHNGPTLIAAQKRRIEELEALVAKLQTPPPCKHERRSGWTNGITSEERCMDCGRQETCTVGAVFMPEIK
jgi:hypothetical protein